MPEVEAQQQMTPHTLSMTPMAQRCAKREVTLKEKRGETTMEGKQKTFKGKAASS